uniref:Tail protein n=1 Tax=viral metagenome TaxID=1070528 RepID=A0A6M3LY68_9ZZZZ
MAVVTKLTGAQGIIQIAGVTVVCEDFTVNIKRGAVLQSRVGKWSDRKIPGKLDISGSFTLDDINGLEMAKLLNATVSSPVSVGNAAKFTISGDANDGVGNKVKVNMPNCFYTGTSMKIGDAGKPINGPMEFVPEDADLCTLEYT